MNNYEQNKGYDPFTLVSIILSINLSLFQSLLVYFWHFDILICSEWLVSQNFIHNHLYSNLPIFVYIL